MPYILKFNTVINKFLPRLLQRSKEFRGHNSTIYHATSQCIMRSDTYTSILLTQCEEIREFEIQNYVYYMYIYRMYQLRC